MKQRFKLIAAVYLVLIKDDQILLLKRQNTGYEDGKYSFIAGHVDGNESLTTAIIREAKEEAGIMINVEDLSFLHVMHRKGETSENERMDFFFTVSSYNGEITNKEPEKCDEITWFPLAKTPDNTIPYIKTAIEYILKKQPLSEYGWE
ncbi:NUDIX domain-containing protein [Candidatus Dojkabacteria bacterium]|uniref:NUDIX domain-containing protein n=1 Tax=Candidatus Dojkabacteria bacterium TaxID=2099670 RepID=A0A955L488_9BACT|nr:NUDIX domain-containing protein [Candidatus Dojkabacteria bacterium]